MAKNERFTIPRENWREFDRLVQRANRKILSNLAYIQKEEIKSDVTRRALLSDYADPTTWHTQKVTFSRSKRFNNEREYQQTLRHLEKWGNRESPDYKDPESLKKGYYKSIIQALTTTAIENGGILDEKGNLPRNIKRRIKNLSLEQMANFFDHGDPSEQFEKQGFSSDDFLGVDEEEFNETLDGLLNNLRKLYPKKRKTRKDKGKKRKRKKK